MILAGLSPAQTDWTLAYQSPQVRRCRLRGQKGIYFRFGGVFDAIPDQIVTPAVLPRSGIAESTDHRGRYP